MEVKLLCHANVREPAMVPYQGGSASNIEAFPRIGSKALMPCQCCANVREPAMVPYQGGSASNIGVLFSQLRVKIVVPQVSEMSLLRCDVVLAGCKQVSGPRGQDEILLLKLHLIVVCMRISLRTSSSSYVIPDTLENIN